MTTIFKRLLRPISITYISIIVIASFLLSRSFNFGDEAALFPIFLLTGMILLSALALIIDLPDSSTVDENKKIIESPGRVIKALVLTILFVISVDLFGFYQSAIFFVPLIAYIFGCHNYKILLFASILVSGIIYLIFDLGMAKEFPIGRIWEELN